MSLKNKTVVVTRSPRGSLEWHDKLVALGAKVYNLPTITMAPVKLDQTIITELSKLEDYDWLIFTSASGVRYLKLLVTQAGINLKQLRLPKVAVIGSKTSSELATIGVRAEFIPSTSSSQALGEELEPVKGTKILLLRTTIASDDLPDILKKRGALVTDLRIYQTANVTSKDPKFSVMLQANQVDFITFASPSAVAGFVNFLIAGDLKIAKRLPVVAIGPSVAEALLNAGFANVATAKQPFLESVIDSLSSLSE